MILLDSMKKIFSKPEPIRVKTDYEKERDFRILDEEFTYSKLDELLDYIMECKDNPLKWAEVEDIYGEDWTDMLTLDEACDYCKSWLKVFNLDIGQTCSHLLSLNRRKPWSEYAIKTGIPKTNWHRYGRCPFLHGERHTYSKVVLHRWLEENVRPHAKIKSKMKK